MYRDSLKLNFPVHIKKKSYFSIYTSFYGLDPPCYCKLTCLVVSIILNVYEQG